MRCEGCFLDVSECDSIVFFKFRLQDRWQQRLRICITIAITSPLMILGTTTLIPPAKSTWHSITFASSKWQYNLLAPCETMLIN